MKEQSKIQEVLTSKSISEINLYSYNPYLGGDSKGVRYFSIIVTGDKIPSLRLYQFIRDDLKISQLSKREKQVFDAEKTKKAKETNRFAKPIMKNVKYLVNNLFTHGKYYPSEINEILLRQVRPKSDINIVIDYNNTTNEINVLYFPDEGMISRDIGTREIRDVMESLYWYYIHT